MNVQMSGWLFLVTLSLFTWNTVAWLQERLDRSNDFEECYGVHASNISGKLPLAENSFEKRCTDLLIPFDTSRKRIGNFTAKEINYIQSIFRKINSETYKIHRNRVRRQVPLLPNSPNNIWRYRQEVRTNNGYHFNLYAIRVRELKATGQYDIIANINRVSVSKAYVGINFLPWHRLILLVLETALGVPIPYYDSSLDHEMEDPTNSCVWEPRYFGEGIGPVLQGRFANFITPAGPLFRKINAGGVLISRPMIISHVWSQRYLTEISTPTARYKSNLEGQSNNVHYWINGIISNLALSAYDPIFFSHYAFIDYIWDIFRTVQSSKGINSETDTGTKYPPGQNPSDSSDLNGLLNSEGYSFKTSNLVSYRRWAQCPSCDISDDVYCDKVRWVCVSRQKPIPSAIPQQIAIHQTDRLASISALKDGKFGPPFTPFANDSRTRGDAVQASQMEKDIIKKNQKFRVS
ncbi:tyrosinase-like protein 1 [Mytilus trossulus]|uniref:tyrosinase-like protein 1 n=1 Tax=Mytilus trossulus TaxID=6551 RepID=UPI003003BF4E